MALGGKLAGEREPATLEIAPEAPRGRQTVECSPLANQIIAPSGKSLDQIGNQAGDANEATLSSRNQKAGTFFGSLRSPSPSDDQTTRLGHSRHIKFARKFAATTVDVSEKSTT